MASSPSSLSNNDIVSLLSPSAASEDAKNDFSRANVFGLFVTISFCLLMQPYGSLLYVKPHNIPARVLFYFWRLNPVACLMEVIILSIAFVDSIRLAFKRRGPANTNSIGFWGHLRTSSSAIQLLRIHGKAPEHWRVFINSQRWPRSTSPYSMISSNGSYLDQPSGLPSNPPPTLQEATSAMPAANVTDLSDAEAGGLESTRTDISISPNSSQLVMNDLGRIVLGRADLVLNLVGIAGIAIVIIRLASTTIPLHIRLPAIFMVINWIFVQVLYLVPNRRDDNSIARELVILHTLNLERRLNHVLVWTLLSLLSLPLFEYLTFATFFQTKTLPIAFRYHIIWVFAVYMFAIDPLYFTIIPGFLSKRKVPPHSAMQGCPSPATTARNIPLIVFHVGKLILCFFAGSFLADSFFACMFLDTVPAKYYVLPFTVIPFTMWAWVFLPGVPFMRRSGRYCEWMRGVALLFNLVATGLFFTGAMMMYDADGSYKPDWLDWLGRLTKF